MWPILIFVALLLCFAAPSMQKQGSKEVIVRPDSKGAVAETSALPPMLFVSTLDGAMHAVNPNTGAKLWTFRPSGPLVRTNYMKAKALFLPDPTDGSLYYYDNRTLQRMPATMQDLVDASPLRGEDGSMYIGHKRSVLYAVDGLSGALQKEFDSTVAGDGLACPATPHTIFLGRVDYSVTMLDKQGKPLWNASYGLYTSAQPATDIHSPTFGERVFFSTAKGEVVARDVVSGLDTWLLAYESPVVSMYMTGDGSLERIPLLLGRQDTQNLWFGHRPKTVAVGQYMGSLYCLPRPQEQAPSRRIAHESADDTLKVEDDSSEDKSLAVYARCDPTVATYPWCLVGLHEIDERQTAKGPMFENRPSPLLLPMGDRAKRGGGVAALGAAFGAGVASVMAAAFVYWQRGRPQDVGAKTKSKKKKANNSKKKGEVKGDDGVEDVEDGTVAVGKLKLFTDCVLGHGSHGTVVYKGSFEDRPVAVKRMLAEYYEIANHEVSLLLHSDHHNNVIRYYVKEHDTQFLYMGLELCQASLADVIERNFPCPLDPPQILAQVMHGIQHLHSLNIVHRDIKPANVLLSSQGRMLISDFGLCKKLSEGQSSFATHVSGTMGWIAPETITLNRMTKAVDIFSAGCVFYYVMSKGQHPFGQPFEREVNIRSYKATLKAVDGHAELKDLIRHMIKAEPERRPTARLVLAHPYFWGPATCLGFLNDVSDILETEAKDSPLLLELEIAAFDTVGRDWHARLDPELLKDLRRFRTYNGASIRDLLRCIRNKKHHYQELNPDLKAVLGSLPEGYVGYFRTRFPGLLMHVYGFITTTQLAQEPRFDHYF